MHTRTLAAATYFIAVLSSCSAPGTAPDSAEIQGSVKPGINDSFLDPELDVDKIVKRFEGESREVFARRKEIVQACGIEPGTAIADVGAGTGMFSWMFADAVGEDGAVYAVDISPKLLRLIENRTRRRGLRHVFPVLCEATDVGLRQASVDAVFACDTYHHFEYPAQTLRSIHRSLGPGGSLFIVDFERIPGVSSEWTLGHVRAGKITVRQEIEAAGFELIDEIDVGLKENYMLKFRKRSAPAAR